MVFSRFKSFCFLGAGILSVLMITACDSSDEPRIPAQQWQELEIVLETRPVFVRPGMNEVLVIATLATGLPGHDMVVSLRMDDSERWQQAIQDGHSGVYRKAIRIQPAQDELQVMLRKKNDEQTELRFKLLTRE